MSLFSTILSLLALAALPMYAPTSTADPTNWALPKGVVSAIRISNYSQGVEAYLATHKQENSSTRFSDRFHLSLESLKQLSNGPAWRIEVSGPSPSPQSVLVLKIKDREQALEQIKQEKYPKKQELQADGTVLFRLLPSGGQQNIAWILSEEYLVQTEDLPATQKILAGTLLAELESTEEELVVHWRIDPWAQLKHLVQNKRAKKDERKALKHAIRHGLEGIRSLSGTARFSAEQTVASESFALVPEERQHSLRLFTVTPADSLEIPEWLAIATNNLLVLHADVPLAFQSMDRVFDDMLADGIEGTYRDILGDLKMEDGLNIDLEKALYSYLGPRVYFVQQENPPEDKTTKSHFLVAFETNNVMAVAAALRVLMEQDEDVTFIERPEQSAKIWRIDSSKEGNRPCLATIHGHAVYATDISLIDQVGRPRKEEQLKRLAAINQRLAKSVASADLPPSFAILGNGESSSRGNDILRVRDTLLTAFFEGPKPISSLQEGSLARIIKEASQTIADQVIVGFAYENGWSFSAADSLTPE